MASYESVLATAEAELLRRYKRVSLLHIRYTKHGLVDAIYCKITGQKIAGMVPSGRPDEDEIINGIRTITRYLVYARLPLWRELVIELKRPDGLLVKHETHLSSLAIPQLSNAVVQDMYAIDLVQMREDHRRDGVPFNYELILNKIVRWTVRDPTEQKEE